MTKITSILVPVDNSDASKNSLSYAKEMAEKFNATVTLLHIYEIPTTITGAEYSFELYAGIEDNLTKYAESILDEAEKEFAGTDLKINKAIKVGNQGMQIIETAENNDYDLIIMGSRGLGNVRSFLLGSVSNYVIHHSKIPVMLIY